MGILQAAGELALAVAVLVIGTGGAVAFVRAVWRWSARVGSQHDMARAVLDTQASIATARANLAAAQATLAEARLPRSLHYAPHLTYSPRITTSRAGDLPDQAPADTAPVRAATFADLLANGMVGQGQPLILGYGSDGAVYGDWKDLYSTGIGGISGSGKSWTAAYLIGQSVLHGANIAILDPHAGDRESLSTRLSPLASRFLCEPADSPKTMVDVVKMMFSEYERRKQRPKEPRIPWIIACDEFSSLMRGELAEALSLLFEAIAEEGRKFEIYGMALGQVWTASRAGGTEVRDNLASQYVHRLRPAQARHLTGLTAADLPKDLLELPPGTCYLMSTSGKMRRVSIPQCTSGDLATVAGLLTDQAPTMPRMNRQESATNQPQNSHPSTPDYSAPQWAEVYTAEEARVIALFLDGYDAAAIVKELHGITSKAGKPYMNKLAEVQAVIRRELQSQQAGLNPGSANGTKAPGYATI